MSSSIAIPTRAAYESSKEGSGSSSSSSYSASPKTPQSKGKGPATTPSTPSSHNRRQSFLSPTFSQQEHTVITIGDRNNGPIRLITCVRSGQGYEWNPELFLPSHIECDFESLDRRREPVVEITLTDEEINNLLPQ